MIDDVSDLVIALAYLSIPAELIYFLRVYPIVLPHKWKLVVVLFAAFIVLCGCTHLISAIEWLSKRHHPVAMTTFKLLCAIFSILTSVVLWAVIPSALSLPVYTQSLELEAEKRITELQSANRSATLANQHKEEFMAFLCHEIRNPCQVITTNTDFLLSTSLTNEQQNYARAINIATDLLVHVANDVLDITRLQSGKLHLESIPVDLHWLLTSIITTMKNQAAAKDIHLDLQLHHDVPQFVTSDPTRIQQLMTNLLSNAIKFTQHGSIMVIVRRRQQPPPRHSQRTSHQSLSNPSSPLLKKPATPFRIRPIRRHSYASVDCTLIDIPTEDDCNDTDDDSQQRCVVEIMVIDTGIGIAPKDVKKLFVPFSQAKLSTSREFGGTGLGLAICHHIVHMMNGTIRVQSTVNQGSTFTMTLPFTITNKRDTDNTFLTEFRQRRSSSLLPVTPQPDDDGHLHKLVVPSPPQSTESQHRRLPSSQPISPRPPISCKEASTSVDSTPLQTRDSSATSSGTECILVVDDNAVNRKLLHRMVSSFGYDVELAEDGADAVQRCMLRKAMFISSQPSCPFSPASSVLPPPDATPDAGEYSCILMDISMPVMDGFEATAKLRSSGYKGPIVALTAMAMSETRDKASDCGMQAVLHKPVRHADLRRALQQHVVSTSTKSSVTQRHRTSTSSSPLSSTAPVSSPRRLTVQSTKRRLPSSSSRVIHSTSSSPLSSPTSAKHPCQPVVTTPLHPLADDRINDNNTAKLTRLTDLAVADTR